MLASRFQYIPHSRTVVPLLLLKQGLNSPSYPIAACLPHLNGLICAVPSWLGQKGILVLDLTKLYLSYPNVPHCLCMWIDYTPYRPEVHSPTSYPQSLNLLTHRVSLSHARASKPHVTPPSNKFSHILAHGASKLSLLQPQGGYLLRGSDTWSRSR